jgi:hypothetical protein
MIRDKSGKGTASAQRNRETDDHGERSNSSAAVRAGPSSTPMPIIRPQQSTPDFRRRQPARHEKSNFRSRRIAQCPRRQAKSWPTKLISDECQKYADGTMSIL